MTYLMLLSAFAGGAVLSVGCYFLAKWVLKRHKEQYVLLSLLRQLLGIGYLAALFFFGRAGAYLYPLLIGGALGLTLPALFLAVKLAKTANTPSDERRDDHG